MNATEKVVLMLCFNILATTALTPQAFANSALEDELVGLIDIYDSGSSKRLSVANEKLKWSGISDRRLFDVIANRLENEKNSKKESNLLIEALGFSGNPAYATTLETLGEKSQYRKNVDKTLPALSRHRIWNPIISQNLEETSARRLTHQRMINMIESDIPELVWEGSRMMFKTQEYDQAAVDAARRVLEAGYNKNTVSGTHMDAMAYLIKVMIGSGDRAVVPLLLEIYDKAVHKKLRRYAEDALERFNVDLD